jgi:uncharacterized protein YaaN involved in tellurite resistance
MGEPTNLVSYKLSMVERQVQEATDLAGAVVDKVVEIGQAIDQIASDLATVQDTLAEAIGHVDLLAKTPGLDDAQKQFIAAIHDKYVDISLSLAALTSEASAELQGRAYELNSGPE